MNAGADHSSNERLFTVEEEIAELEERLRELRAEQQELSELQELSVTVSNLAWNVTSDMVRMTFEQVAVVVTAAVQHDEDTGRSLGWAVVEFGRGSDAAGAVARFSGVELVGRRMVVEFGAGRDCEEDVI